MEWSSVGPGRGPTVPTDRHAVMCCVWCTNQETTSFPRLGDIEIIGQWMGEGRVGRDSGDRDRGTCSYFNGEPARSNRFEGMRDDSDLGDPVLQKKKTKKNVAGSCRE